MGGYTYLCYTHEDTKFVLKLARSLRQQEVDVWLDQWHMPQGERWDRPLTEALLGCGDVLLVLSPEAVTSWIVRDQTLNALDAGKRVLPVVCRPCTPPAVVEGRPVIDFSRSFQAGMAQLLSEYYQRPAPPGINVRSRMLSSSTGLPPWPWIITGLTLALMVGLAITLLPRGGREIFRAPSHGEVVSLDEPVLLAEVDALQQVEPQSTPINTFRRARDQKVMVLVPSGDFLMGSLESDPDADEDEKPQHTVYLESFWIDQTETTNAEYQGCVAAGACTPNWAIKGMFTGSSAPVVGVRWDQAAAYCQWVGGRLPTEAEWEKSARGIDGRLFPWGNDLDGSRLNYCDSNCVADWRDLQGDDGYRYTAPVGSYPAGASPYGVLDLSGNVWEWTATWYDPRDYTLAVYRNPTGPESGVQRVIRGGSWLYAGQSLRAARRHKDVPTSRYDNIGFRCAMSQIGLAESK